MVEEQIVNVGAIALVQKDLDVVLVLLERQEVVGL